MTNVTKGHFCWYECYSDDPTASEAFYSELFGWGSKPWGPDGFYTIIANGDRDVGGYMQLTEDI